MIYGCNLEFSLNCNSEINYFLGQYILNYINNDTVFITVKDKQIYSETLTIKFFILLTKLHHDSYTNDLFSNT